MPCVTVIFVSLLLRVGLSDSNLCYGLDSACDGCVDGTRLRVRPLICCVVGVCLRFMVLF